MGRDLDEIIARVGVRRGKAGGEAIVDGLAGLGMPQTRAEDRAWRCGVERFEAAGGDGDTSGARKTNQGKCAATRRRRERDDGVRKQSRS